MLFGGGAHLGTAILVEPGWRQVVAVETLQQALLIRTCWRRVLRRRRAGEDCPRERSEYDAEDNSHGLPSLRFGSAAKSVRLRRRYSPSR